MFSNVVPDLPTGLSSGGTVLERLGRLEEEHRKTLAALNAYFQQTNLAGSLQISEATIDGSPIGATNPDTGAFDSININANGAISRLDFDTYTPTLTGVANLDAVTAYVAQWLAVGNGVVVSGKFDANAAAAGALCQFGLSLPIASDFTAEEDCGGVAFARAVAGQGAAIRADATNNRAMVEWTAADTADRAMSFILFYRVK
jgi:hypothetical protein